MSTRHVQLAWFVVVGWGCPRFFCLHSFTARARGRCDRFDDSLCVDTTDWEYLERKAVVTRARAELLDMMLCALIALHPRLPATCSRMQQLQRWAPPSAMMSAAALGWARHLRPLVRRCGRRDRRRLWSSAMPPSATNTAPPPGGEHSGMLPMSATAFQRQERLHRPQCPAIVGTSTTLHRRRGRARAPATRQNSAGLSAWARM